jgi:hypothetical protein
MTRITPFTRRTGRLTAALVGGILAAILVGAAVTIARDSEPAVAGQERTLQFDVQFHTTIIAPAGPAPGAQFLLSDTLLAAGQAVGHNGGACVLVSPAEASCSVTYALADGTITTQFLNAPPPVKAFAITGGTGAYQGVRGEGELVENGDGPPDGTGGTGRITFRLRN